MDSPNPNPNSNPDQTGLKRKRSPGPEDGRGTGSAAGPVGGLGAGAGVSGRQINYLVRAKSERLSLIEGDSEIFGDMLGTIDDYEGMLSRELRWSRKFDFFLFIFLHPSYALLWPHGLITFMLGLY